MERRRILFRIGFAWKCHHCTDMNDRARYSQGSAEKVEISIHLDSELLAQIKHLTNDPSKVIETAIRQWLRGERDRDDELTRNLERNPPVPPRGEWND
ncbi:type II toxin-antitoxin system CcdA family antitoxin [Trichocoleus sp. Lan]